jgi:hypothetical protein
MSHEVKYIGIDVHRVRLPVLSGPDVWLFAFLDRAFLSTNRCSP